MINARSLSPENVQTAEAVTRLVLKAVTHGKTRDKAMAALCKVESAAYRALQSATDYANVYPLRGSRCSIDQYDTDRSAACEVARVVVEVIASERSRRFEV